jgi:hypothetical protein
MSTEQEQGTKDFVDSFFDENPDLKGHVEMVIGVAKKMSPQKAAEARIEAAAQIVRKNIERIKAEARQEAEDATKKKAEAQKPEPAEPQDDGVPKNGPGESWDHADYAAQRRKESNRTLASMP